MAFCPKCRSEYRERVQVCPTCGETLVDVLPPLPKRQGITIPRVKRFLYRFAGRDTSPPRLQSFLLEQPPDWRHSALAIVLVVAMTQAGIGKAMLLRTVFAPTSHKPEWEGVPSDVLAVMLRISPLMIAGVVLGSMTLGLAGALVARRREWLWGPVGLCIGIAIELLWLQFYYPRAEAIRLRGHSNIFVTWRFYISAYRVPLVLCALACAAAGGTLAKTRLRRWSAGIVTVCVAMSAIGAFWNIETLLALAAGHPYLPSGLPRYAYVAIQSSPYLAAGAWVGWAMRRWGLGWGAALGLLPLYQSVTRRSSLAPFAPLTGKLMAPVRFVQYARSEGILDAVATFASMADYRGLSAVIGGLLGWYLWQWKVRRTVSAPESPNPDTPPMPF